MQFRDKTQEKQINFFEQGRKMGGWGWVISIEV